MSKNGRWTLIATAVIAAAGGSGGGTYLYFSSLGPKQVQAIARPDPATGSELAVLSSEVRRHIDRHPDEINRFDRRITTLEAENRDLLRRLERLEDSHKQGHDLGK